MRELIKRRLYYFALSYKEAVDSFFAKAPLAEGGLWGYLFKKYSWHFFIVLGLAILSLISAFLPQLAKQPAKPLSLDRLVPKGFVLLPIEISNGKDIISLIGSYGVVDLYAYSGQTGLPEQQAASAVKILPPDTEDGRFSALAPAKEAPRLFGYSDPFYAVIQNPEKKGSKIYKKRSRKNLIVIEENF